jgi:hypothetical protein
MRADSPTGAALVALALVLGACERDASTPDHPERVDGRRLVEAPTAEADFLEALGYVEGSVDPQAEKRGVLLHDADRAWSGVNLYYSRTQQQAQLIDMQGAVLHTWAADTAAPWQHVHLDPQTGDILVLMKDVGLVAFDRGGVERWRWEGRAHHDLWVDDDGVIHLLARDARVMPDRHATIELLDDKVVRLSPTGEVLGEWSVLQALAASPYAFLLPDLSDIKRKKKRKNADLDILHTNHVEVFDGSLAHVHPRYAAGNVLLSMRNIHTVMILNGETHAIEWIWGPSNLTFQHHPTVLDDGHVLIFNNGTAASEVVELDPDAGRVVWRYQDGVDFFSRTRGSAYRLPNGNTLITESDTGYVIEVTPDGDPVWEFANPDVQADGTRGAIWRMTRYSADDLAFLAAP